MQRPRRTAEIDTATKHQSRQRVTSPGTANKYTTRQSRIPSRRTSQERGSRTSQERGRRTSQERVSNSAAFIPSSTTGVAFGRATPQKSATPLTKSSASRALFSAEKRYGGVNSTPLVGLHNDKRWVNDQSQIIMEYLAEKSQFGTIIGIGPDFFTRNGGLRAMSIKQFIAIINFFLDKISGNRLVIGTNHVDDIVNVLQKLDYPYQLNKSCLKTPTTQHSFGNIVLIMSFLMELCPPDLPEDGNLFDFQDLNDGTISLISKSDIKPDKEFLARLMSDAAEVWNPWNEQNMDEFSACQQRTCDFLIQQMSGMQNIKELEANIVRLKNHLQGLQSSKKAKPNDLKHLYDQLEVYKKEVQVKYKEIEAKDKKIRELKAKKKNNLETLRSLKQTTEQLKKSLETQTISVEDFNNLIFQVDQLKYQKNVHQRTVDDLLKKNHELQIKLSRKKKHLTDEIEAFNATMRRLRYSSGSIETEADLHLTLNPDQDHLNAILPALKSLKEKVKITLLDQEKHRQKLLLEISSINIHINDNLLPSIEMIEADFVKEEKDLKDRISQMEKENLIYDEKIKELKVTLQGYRNQIEGIEKQFQEKTKQLELKKKANEELEKKIEEKYKICSEERSKHQDEVAKALEEAEAQCNRLEMLLDEIELKEDEDEDL